MPKIHLVSVLDGIDNLGMRKFAAYVQQLNKDTEVSFVIPGQYRDLISLLLMKDDSRLDEAEVCEVARELAKADLIGFSSMTGYAHVVKEIIAEVRRISPETYIMWGGIHAIVEPEDAIQFADAVCTGEGEFAFEQFYRAFVAGEDHFSTPGFWFNTPDRVVKNPNLPLMTGEDMDDLPFMVYQDGETIYKKGQAFVPITSMDFVRMNSLAYPTIWTIGCPFKCTFCANSKFIDYDSAYRRLRYPSIAYMIGELKRAIEKNPHISTILFSDDSFLALKYDVLKEFARQYKAEVGLPFAIAGVIPNYVRDEKIRILVEAGMNRVRMGIQSGSERILEFYDRPTPIPKIRKATEILGKYAPYMTPPVYDIILDNPIETSEDTFATLDLIYEMPRPFVLNLYSLRVIPNTVLAKSVEAEGIDIESINSNYSKHMATFGNCLVYLLLIWKIPRGWYEFLRKFAKPSFEPQKQHYMLMVLLRLLYLTKRACFHLGVLDFTTLPGIPGYVLWKLGIIGWWQRHMIRRIDSEETGEQTLSELREAV